MFLFLLSQMYNSGYDTFDSCIVAAESEEQAILIHPYGNVAKSIEDIGHNWDYHSWALPQHIKVQKIGIALKGQQEGVILASFNAG